jgi:hypothetical protein
MKNDTYTAILECWYVVLVHTMSTQATKIMLPSLSTLLEEIVITASASNLISDICLPLIRRSPKQNTHASDLYWRMVPVSSADQHRVVHLGCCLCLSHAYQSLPSSQPLNVERAIYCFQRALNVLDSTNHPEQWAAAHHGLGDLVGNTTAAIEYFKLSISLTQVDSMSFRKATVLFEIVNLYDTIHMPVLEPCMEHVKLCLAELDADRTSDERLLKALVHRFAGNIFVRAAQAQCDNVVAAGFDLRAVGFDLRAVGGEAIRHYQQLLQVLPSFRLCLTLCIMRVL